MSGINSTMDIPQMISDALSIITISLCLFLKVPQIKSICTAQNARGINIYGLLMELTSYSITCLYNVVNGYALLSYMEYPIIIFQEYVLIYLVLLYQDLLSRRTKILAASYFILVLGFLLGTLPPSILTFLIPFCTPMSLSSKAVQLMTILRTKNADSVSVTTWVISATTNASRIYTISLDSADMILLTNFTLSTGLSGAIAIAAYVLQQKKYKAL